MTRMRLVLVTLIVNCTEAGGRISWTSMAALNLRIKAVLPEIIWRSVWRPRATIAVGMEANLSKERTFLAWLRTSLSFASIGIAITQLFRLNTSLSDSNGNGNNSNGTASDPAASLKQVGKPLGATFLGICKWRIDPRWSLLMRHASDCHLAPGLPSLL